MLLYFDQSEFCPVCKEARAILNSPAVREKWRPNYVVVTVDLFAPTKEEREIIRSRVGEMLEQLEALNV